MDEEQNILETERGEMGQQIGGQAGSQLGGYAGAAIGGYFGGPLGATIGQYVGEKVGEKIGEEVGDKVEDKINEHLHGDSSEQGNESNDQQKKKGGGCSGETQGVEDYSTASNKCHGTPETPKFKLEIQKNNLPENWWDKLPDFDPRVYDAIAMEQAAACVDYIF